MGVKNAIELLSIILRYNLLIILLERKIMRILPLLRGRTVTLEEALLEDDHILHHLEYPKKKEKFWELLGTHKSDIEEAVKFHLRIEGCCVTEEKEWQSGSFNVVIPVILSPPSEERVMIRISLPYKIGEELNPGNVVKLRGEVATYIWIHENCPTVPIPTLHGFAFLDGTTTGYMIISYVKTGRILSGDWKSILHDTSRRRTLFNDLGRIMVALNSIPLPRIGSLSMNNDGVIDVTNRPLTLRLHTMENEGIPIIPRDSTYESIEPYLLDFLQCHDNRIHYQPNAVHDHNDGIMQCSSLVMMRGVMHQYLSRQHRNGPFLLTLTDLHASNIFVDEDWHITSLIGLEWACSFPVEMQIPPYWITCQAIDSMGSKEQLEEFTAVITEFMDIFEKQEKMFRGADATQAKIMKNCWENGSYWYFLAVHSPKGLWRVFRDHIQRRFCEEHLTEPLFDHIVAPYWAVGTQELIKKKVADDVEYC
ncbi:hypothetical protein LOZ60_005452 [Ophidiomyces ophidiicola]|nr:hypothetical protein LOZ60_005452 [Ophidiomyces ophidiicola]KAI2217918.1 hypothetical protein LOZ15_003451 [Ophidiomyces ophidiicola]